MICDCLPIAGVLLSETFKLRFFFSRPVVESSGTTRQPPQANSYS